MYQPYSSTGQYGGAALSAAWMARAASQGRDWARILFTVLCTLATLQLIESRGIVRVFTVALTWLIGLAAMWLLWRPEGYGHE
jgi:hypothetical protein